MDLFDLLVKVSIDTSEFEQSLNDLKGEASSAGDDIERSFEKRGGIFSNMSKGANGFGSQMAGVGSKVMGVGRAFAEVGDRLTAIGGRITNSVTKPALNAAAALGKMVLGKGWERMSTITEAKNKLRILGVEGKNLDKTMEDIGNTVDGTAYSTAQFANTAAQAVSMGYDTDNGLLGYLKNVADMAAFTGRDVEQISSIQAKIASQNKLTGDSFQQLSDAAVPILQWIQDEYGVTAEEARKMVSDGKISFADYQKMVEKNLGGMAQAVGDSTLQGALSSTEAYIARLGAAFLGSEDNAKSFAGQLLPLVNKFNEWLVSMGDKAGEIGSIFGEVFGALVEYVSTGNVNLEEMSGSAQTVFETLQPFVDAIMGIVDAGKKLYEFLGPEKTAMIVAGLMLLGPVISIIGGLAGVISSVTIVVGALSTVFGALAGPVGIIIAAIGLLIVIGVQLYKNWDEIKAKAGELKDSIAEKWEEIKTAISEKIEAAKEKVDSAIQAIKSFFSFEGAPAKARAAFEAVKAGIQSKIESARARVSSVINTIKGSLSFSGAAAKAGAAFENIKKAISDKIDAAKDKVKRVIDTIKGYFPFNVGKVFSGWVPKIRLRTNKSGDSASTSSSTSRESFAKAMDRPYLFKRDTLVNQYAGHTWGGGEVMYGKNNLMKDIRSAVEGTGGGGDIIINLNYTAGDDANDMVRDIARGIQRYKMAGVF